MASGRARQTFRPIDTDKVMTLLSFLKNKTSLHGITCWRQGRTDSNQTHSDLALTLSLTLTLPDLSRIYPNLTLIYP